MWLRSIETYITTYLVFLSMLLGGRTFPRLDGEAKSFPGGFVQAIHTSLPFPFPFSLLLIFFFCCAFGRPEKDVAILCWSHTQPSN
jgi:hypothetical protein